MVDEHDALRTELAAYALEALDAPERGRLAAHLGGCRECARSLAEYRQIGDLLPYALPSTPPPPEARAALLARVRGQAAGQVAQRAGLRERLGALLSPLRWFAIAALVAGLLLWNVQLQQQLGAARPAPGISQLVEPAGEALALVGTGSPGASARLHVSPDSTAGSLAVTGLAPLPAERTYQLWFARPGQPTVTGGTFRVNSNGQALAAVFIPAPLDQVSAIAVTDEPAPASPSPTGKHLLDWTPPAP